MKMLTCVWCELAPLEDSHELLNEMAWSRRVRRTRLDGAQFLVSFLVVKFLLVQSFHKKTQVTQQ